MSTKVELTADGEVLGISPKGRETKSKFVLSKATRTIGEENETAGLLSPGTQVIAERIGTKTEFLINGIAAEPDVAKALAVIISLESDDIASDDDVFGTSERKKVGDSWAINSSVATADLNARYSISVDASNFTGTVTLAKLVKKADEEALHITTTFQMKDASIPLPPGVVVQSSLISADLSGLFPVDPLKPAIQRSMSMDGKIVCGGKTRDKEMSMVMTMKRTKEVTFTPKSPSK